MRASFSEALREIHLPFIKSDFLVEESKLVRCVVGCHDIFSHVAGSKQAINGLRLIVQIMGDLQCIQSWKVMRKGDVGSESKGCEWFGSTSCALLVNSQIINYL